MSTSPGAPEDIAGVAGIVLAAGRSTRFDGEVSKQLLAWDGEPLVRRAARTALAAPLARVLVVVGHAEDAVRAALAGLDVEIVANPAHAEGQSTSVRAGLARLPKTTADAVFQPVDQPFLSADLLAEMIEAWRVSGRAIVRPRSGDRPGAPVLFARSLFPELAKLSGDEGGRQILARHREEILDLEVDDPRQLADIDTVEDWRRMRRRE